jgi:hypothetical protein
LPRPPSPLLLPCPLIPQWNNKSFVSNSTVHPSLPLLGWRTGTLLLELVDEQIDDPAGGPHVRTLCGGDVRHQKVKARGSEREEGEVSLLHSRDVVRECDDRCACRGESGRDGGEQLVVLWRRRVRESQAEVSESTDLLVPPKTLRSNDEIVWPIAISFEERSN